MHAQLCMMRLSESSFKSFRSEVLRCSFLLPQHRETKTTTNTIKTQKTNRKFQELRYTTKYWKNEQNGVYQVFSCLNTKIVLTVQSYLSTSCDP
eukprot:4938656-Amphidinium_carterae.1